MRLLQSAASLARSLDRQVPRPSQRLSPCQNQTAALLQEMSRSLCHLPLFLPGRTRTTRSRKEASHCCQRVPKLTWPALSIWTVWHVLSSPICISALVLANRPTQTTVAMRRESTGRPLTLNRRARSSVLTCHLVPPGEIQSAEGDSSALDKSTNSKGSSSSARRPAERRQFMAIRPSVTLSRRIRGSNA